MIANIDSWINLDALWKIVVVGLLCGAGLPALFAIGLRSLSLPVASRASASGSVRSGSIVGGSALGLVGAVMCFAVVLAAIAWGIYMIVSSS